MLCRFALMRASLHFRGRRLPPLHPMVASGEAVIARKRPARRLAVLAALGGLVATTACQASGLHFKASSRIEITQPADLSTVTVPFVMRWSVAAGTPSVGSATVASARFGVFVDTTPMPPGDTVRFFAKGDSACEHTPGCPSISYLRNKNVYLTNDTRLVIAGLADTRPTGRKSTADRHRLTIIPLAPGGRRLGDSFYTVTIFVDRHHPSFGSS